jgi:hypothetical protein
MEWLPQCTGRSSCLEGRGDRVLDADHITGSVSHGSHGTAPLPTEQACFLGVLPPPPPLPFSLYIFLVQFFSIFGGFFFFLDLVFWRIFSPQCQKKIQFEL